MPMGMLGGKIGLKQKIGLKRKKTPGEHWETETRLYRSVATLAR